MRSVGRSGSFFLCLLINLLFNLEWSVPAWLLLAAHFIFGISIWWFVGGIGFWILRILIGMWFMSWASACSNTPDPPKENKNPYSNKGYDYQKK